jgi:type I restriction enzyme S subunit
MSWKTHKLGDILERKRDKVSLLPDEYYKLVTIKLRHQGVVLREEKKGKDIKSNMHFVKEGDFILSGIDARNGAFGIVPKELDNAIVTNDFWCLEPKKDILLKEFFLFITSTSFFDYICKQCSDGTTQRIRLQRDKFYNYEISLPVIEEQGKTVKILTKNKQLSSVLSTELTHQLDVVKQLRQAFLREAMQGKLVEQNQADEPATELLAKIKAEKEQLIKEKKIKKQKPLPPISEDEIPFEIPENWVWCRLGDICFKITDGFHNTPPKLKEGYPYIAATHVKTNTIDWVNSHYVAEKFHRELHNKAYPQKGELLVVNIGAGCGTSAIIDVDYEFSFKNTAILKFNQSLVSNKLLNYYFIWKRDEIYEELTKGGLQPFLSLTILNSINIPLPPFSEQKRIVAKLDELMAYCDSLEESIKNSQTQNEMLLGQVLREALEPKKEEAYG